MKRLLLPFALLICYTATAQLSLDIACDIDVTGHGNPQCLTLHNGAMYFYASNGVNVGELFRYTDTGACALVQDINPNGPAMETIAGVGNPSMLSFGGKLYFTATNDTNGYELFMYDGTSVSLAADIAPGSMSSDPRQLTAFNDKIYFSATDTGSVVTNYELWCYDPATGLATQVAEIAHNGNSHPGNFCVYNSKLYFSAVDSAHGHEVRCYDPITDSVTLAAEIAPFDLSAWPGKPVVANGKMYFHATDWAFGDELYEYNGTTAQRITDIWPGYNGGIQSGPYLWNNDLYFGGYDGNAVYLYRYDFTNNTAIIADTINFGIQPAPRNFIAYGSRLYFETNTPGAGLEPWVYDGDSATILADINLGPDNSYPYHRAVYNNKLYMSGVDSMGVGNELWVLTDSTLTVKETASQNNTISLYPNPNDGTFTIRRATNSGDITGMQVINLPGSVVFTSEEWLHNNSINQQITLPAHLSPGTYFLKLHTSNGQQVLRFVKE